MFYIESWEPAGNKISLVEEFKAVKDRETVEVKVASGKVYVDLPYDVFRKALIKAAREFMPLDVTSEGIKAIRRLHNIEPIDAVNDRSNAAKKREDTRKMADANKPSASFKF